MPRRPPVDPRFEAWLSRSISRRSLLVSSAMLCAMPYTEARRARRRTRLAAVDGVAVYARRRLRRSDADGRRVVDPARARSHQRRRPGSRTRAGELGNRVGRPHAADREERHGDGDAEWAHSVHVEVDGLEPDRWYWYRFTAGGADEPGRPHAHAAARRAGARSLRFAFASCQHYEQGSSPPTSTWRDEDLDLIIHLGDYIYEGAGADEPRAQARRARARRRSTTTGTATRSTGRDPHLQAAHARASRGSSPGTTTRSTTTTPTTSRSDDDPARRVSRCGAPPRTRPTTSTCRCGGRRMPRGPAVQFYRRIGFGHAGVVPRARHAAVPHRPALRRRHQAAVRRKRTTRRPRCWATSRNGGCSTACGQSTRAVERARRSR